MNIIAYRARQKVAKTKYYIGENRLIWESNDPLWTTREMGPTGAWLFQPLLLDAMTIYTGKSGPSTALRIKLTEELYIP
jgi:hypothetical protein